MCTTLLMLLVFVFPSNLAACESFALAMTAATESKLIVLDELQPQPLIRDFNGDGEADLALFVADRATKKHGVCMLHAGTSECVVLGAGHSFHAGGDDFRWVDQWEVLRKGETWISARWPSRGARLAGRQNETVVRRMAPVGGSFRTGRHDRRVGTTACTTPTFAAVSS